VPRLLVIHHSPTASLRALTGQVVAGAGDDAIEDVEVVATDALAFARGEADHTDILEADGYVIGTSANFGSMSGALKHVFDSTFLQIGGALDAGGAGDPTASGATKGRPFGLYVHGRYDTVGAVRSVLSITGALGWRQGYDVLEVLGDVGDAHLEAAYELGGTIAALLAG
jgi:NAD(P)H-dependent FMN reductase